MRNGLDRDLYINYNNWETEEGSKSLPARPVSFRGKVKYVLSSLKWKQKSGDQHVTKANELVV